MKFFLPLPWGLRDAIGACKVSVGARDRGSGPWWGGGGGGGVGLAAVGGGWVFFLGGGPGGGGCRLKAAIHMIS